MPKTPYYIVECGNWKVRVKVDEFDEYTYVEAATRAIDSVFGKRTLSDNCEITSLVSASGDDYFDADSNDEKIPPPSFGIVTAVCHESDASHYNKYMVFLTRELFENAGQSVNVELARKAELMDPAKVVAFEALKKKREKRNKKS